MKQADLEDAVMRYLAQDDSDEPRFQPLSEILKQMPEGRQLTAEQADDDEVEDREELRMALDQLVMDRMIERHFGERDYEGSYRITPEGFYQAVVGPESLVAEGAVGDEVTVNPTDWTGSRLVYIDSEALVKIRKTAARLQALSRQVNYESQDDAEDIQGLCDALVGLCEMAQPDTSIIDRITAHPKFKHYASLLVFVATIRGAIGF